MEHIKQLENIHITNKNFAQCDKHIDYDALENEAQF